MFWIVLTILKEQCAMQSVPRSIGLIYAYKYASLCARMRFWHMKNPNKISPCSGFVPLAICSIRTYRPVTITHTSNRGNIWLKKYHYNAICNENSIQSILTKCKRYTDNLPFEPNPAPFTDTSAKYDKHPLLRNVAFELIDNSIHIK